MWWLAASSKQWQIEKSTLFFRSILHRFHPWWYSKFSQEIFFNVGSIVFKSIKIVDFNIFSSKGFSSIYEILSSNNLVLLPYLMRNWTDFPECLNCLSKVVCILKTTEINQFKYFLGRYWKSSDYHSMKKKCFSQYE